MHPKTQYIACMKFDFGTYGRDGHLSVVLEVKRRWGTSPGWAMEFRRNLLVHGAPPSSDFFIIATPDRLYLWKAGSGPDVPPESVDARPIFEPYFHRVNVSASEIQPEAFEHLVSWWLDDVVNGTFDPASVPELRKVVEVMFGGRVEREFAA